ncbi:hypothetical protein JMUB6875_70020 [Nocardia sp. JMUB6875]|uniref:hypothetical protein n=1 Tax=Nocardia sp. JMUB6875 TaxID=3158170 RepID=UPI0032E74BB6
MRRIAWAATTLASVATLAALSTPIAGARIDGAPILTDTATGAEVGSAVVGRSYQIFPGLGYNPGLSAVADFFDNGQCIASAPAATLTVIWVPTTAGTHTLTVQGAPNSVSMTVEVAPASAGSTPVKPPNQPGCGIGGGSSNVLASAGSGALGGVLSYLLRSGSAGS